MNRMIGRAHVEVYPVRAGVVPGDGRVVLHLIAFGERCAVSCGRHMTLADVSQAVQATYGTDYHETTFYDSDGRRLDRGEFVHDLFGGAAAPPELTLMQPLGYGG